MREFSEKTAVVTGAASGMGLAFARRFAAEGMNVVLADIEQEALDAQVQQLQQEERNVLGVIVNTMRRETLEDLRERTIERFGNIHILCNNAGVASLEDTMGLPAGQRGVWEIPDSTWDWVMGVNFRGVLYGLQAFVPHMLAHGEEGHIVNTASLAGLMPGGGAYGVSKHAVLALTENLYQDLEARGSKLSASVLCPGVVQTKIMEAERNRPDEFGAALELGEEQRTMLSAAFAGAMSPEDVAELVLEAIVEQRCYVLPHTGLDEIVRGRTEQVLARGAPLRIELDLEEMMRRRAAGELV